MAKHRVFWGDRGSLRVGWWLEDDGRTSTATPIWGPSILATRQEILEAMKHARNYGMRDIRSSDIEFDFSAIGLDAAEPAKEGE